MPDHRDHLPAPQRRPGGEELPAWPVLVVAGVVLYLGVVRPASLRASGSDGRLSDSIASAERSDGAAPARSLEGIADGLGFDGWPALAPLPESAGPAARRTSRDPGGADSDGRDRADGPAPIGDARRPRIAHRTSSVQPSGRPPGADPDSDDWKVHTSSWPDGSLEARGHVVEGERVGEWELFAPGGHLIEVIDYDAGVRHGDWRAFADDGTLIGSGEYDGGLRNGSWVLYYSDGAIRERGEYRAGLREGVWEFYDDLGLPTVRAGVYAAGVRLD